MATYLGGVGCDWLILFKKIPLNGWVRGHYTNTGASKNNSVLPDVGEPPWTKYKMAGTNVGDPNAWSKCCGAAVARTELDKEEKCKDQTDKSECLKRREERGKRKRAPRDRIWWIVVAINTQPAWWLIARSLSLSALILSLLCCYDNRLLEVMVMIRERPRARITTWRQSLSKFKTMITTLNIQY